MSKGLAGFPRLDPDGLAVSFLPGAVFHQQPARAPIRVGGYGRAPKTPPQRSPERYAGTVVIQLERFSGLSEVADLGIEPNARANRAQGEHLARPLCGVYQELGRCQTALVPDSPCSAGGPGQPVSQPRFMADASRAL